VTPLSDLRPRERCGLILAIIALAVALNSANYHFRIWLRDTVAGGAPFWADHLFFMVTLMVVVWGAIGLLLLGPRGMALGLPARPREAWWVGILSGLGLTLLVMAAMAALGALVFEPHPNWPVLFANFISNFYEEFIFRGAILGFLLKVLEGRGGRWTAALISAAIFCQGHLHYPPLLVATVFVAGLVWAGMTIRYQSLWPAWLSHTLADTIVDNLFRA
jgi:membrane protease YdiL (CAAX protease family)